MKNKVIRLIKSASAFCVDNGPLLTSIEDLDNEVVIFSWHDSDGNLFRQDLDLNTAVVKGSSIIGKDEDGENVVVKLYKLSALI
jgi:hypothetical protein